MLKIKWMNPEFPRLFKEAARQLDMTGEDHTTIDDDGMELIVLRIDGELYNKILAEESSFLLPIDGENRYVVSF